jgi:hypothetical protein
MMRAGASPRFDHAAGQAPPLRQKQPTSQRDGILRLFGPQNDKRRGCEGYFAAASSSAAALSRTAAT